MFLKSKQTNRTLIVGVLIGLFGLIGTQGMAFAADCGGCTPQTNTENLAKAKRFAEQALEHARQGYKAETIEAAKESSTAFKRIVSQIWAPKLQRPGQDIRYAGYAAKKDELDKAAALLESGIAGLSGIGPFK